VGGGYFNKHGSFRPTWSLYRGNRRPSENKKKDAHFIYLSLYSLCCIFFVSGKGYGEGRVLLIVLANFGMESTFIFYNSFLPQLKRGSGIGKMSALGFGTGYLGSIVSLFLSLLLVQKKLVRLVWPFCPFFFSYSLCLYSSSSPLKDPIQSSILFSAKKGLSETLRLMRTLFKNPDLKRFFLAYLFYEDGINTVIVFSSIYDLFLCFFF